MLRSKLKEFRYASSVVFHQHSRSSNDTVTHNKSILIIYLEKCNTMTIELSKYKERDMLQMNELSDLRQSSVLFERVYFAIDL
jgi:hypothetical protein